MLFKIKTNSIFVYSFIFKNKQFLYFYNNSCNNKFIVRIPKGFFSLGYNNLYLIIISSYFIKISKVISFIKLLYKNIFFYSGSFYKSIILVGLGFKIEMVDSHFIKLYVNYSHPIFFFKSNKISISTTKNQNFFISSSQKNSLDIFSFFFTLMRKPNLFKNKGIFFYNLLASK